MPIIRKNKKKEIPEMEESGKIEETKPDVENKESDKKAKRSPGKFNRFLRAVAIGVLLIVLGAAGLFFAVYQPRTNELNAQIKTLQTDMAAAEAKLTSANSEVDRLKTVESDLTKTKSDLVDLQRQLEVANAKRSVYQIQSDVNSSRIALLTNDAAGAEQSITYLIQNLSDLEVPAFPDITKNLETRLTDIKTLITTDKNQALDRLKELYADMLRLADNIK